VKPGLFQILIIAMIVLVFFGRGRISEMMGDFGKGIKSFKKGVAEEDEPAPARIDGAVAEAHPAADKTAR
jgi:sec-independent protein translocase protein TatA